MAMVSIHTPDLRTMNTPAALDPDISATLSDFLSYTEHLPSAVVRSLTLIETLNSKAVALQKQIHDLLTTYSILPTIQNQPDLDPPDPVRMRRDISHAYDKLEQCKRMSTAEAARIEELVTREAKRLHLVAHKLHVLPLPPSRDPTPDPMRASPNMKRAQSQAQQSADKRVAAHRTTTAPRVRNKDKLMIPGEVLPPPNPDSPSPSEPDDWSTPPPQDPQHARQKSVARQKTPKPPGQPRSHKDKDKDTKAQKTPRIRPPGTPGTNAHSAVAGISTSNAIMALKKPPSDAVPGSSWLPWKRLTEYELALLRKRMKKNAAWKPSPAMRNRELKDLGRGMQAMDAARAEAEATGTTFVDDDQGNSFWTDPTMTHVTGEQQAEMNAILGPETYQPDGDQALINRGMRLNEAKKLKRDMAKLEEQQALLQAAKAESENKSQPLKDQANDVSSKDNSQKKRKRHTTPLRSATAVADLPAESPDVLSLPRAPERKKLKLNPPTQPSDTLLQPKSATPLVPSPRFATRPKSRRTSVAADPPPPAPPTNTRASKSSTTITLKRQKAASAEPPARRALRRGSVASLPGAGGNGNKKTQSPAPKATEGDDPPKSSSRRRRPAPGVVRTQEDGSAKVSVGKRSKPPSKKGAAAAAAKGDSMTPAKTADLSELPADPNEETYCVCDDVSFGVMIACDAADCPREWFHLECVGLKEMPPRRAKWFCPDCRKKGKLGVASNGIVLHR